MNRCRQISSIRSPASSSTTVIAHLGRRMTYWSKVVPSGSSTDATLSRMCGFSSTTRSAWIVQRVCFSPCATVRGYRRCDVPSPALAPAGSQPGHGTLRYPLPAYLGLFPRRRGRRCSWVSAGRVPVSVLAGSARYASRSWRAQRALGWGKGGRGSGGTGETRALGGFPGSPGALQFPCPAGAARYSRPVLCTFPGHLRGGVRRCFSGGGRRGLGNLEPGPCFSGAGGGSGFSPVRFRIGLPCCLFTRVVEP